MYLRNLQEEVKKGFCYQKLFWHFTVWINCSSHLKIFANSLPSASNFNLFSRLLEQIFLTVGQNNFGNKIPLLYKNSDVPMTKWKYTWTKNTAELFENSSTMQPAIWSEMQYELLSTYLKKVFSLLSLSKLSSFAKWSSLRRQGQDFLQRRKTFWILHSWNKAEKIRISETEKFPPDNKIYK